ncbi:hypothetical protein ColLi_03319 [Colletotrichum liriopes]|uniref:Uncharacterized protein n=1 Tax=Colletotrichum liriopes TaxID=708192 RepID=A0AA37GHI0_9PEZI|nr:hypothetical protein ColLi_03319 [Colletotrichum liriopes]
MMSILALESGFVSATALAAAIPLLLVVAYLAVNPMSMDPKEPHLVRPRVPFVGHILGILWHSWKYLDMI